MNKRLSSSIIIYMLYINIHSCTCIVYIHAHTNTNSANRRGGERLPHIAVLSFLRIVSLMEDF